MKYSLRNKEWLLLYQQGLTDREMAKKIGCPITKISAWRRGRNLKSNKPDWSPKDKFDVSKKPLHEREIIKTFAGDLIHLCDRAKHIPDAQGIGKFMTIWREKEGKDNE